MDIECGVCGKNLYGHPKIDIQNNIFCFSCAKEEINRLVPEVTFRFNKEAECFNERKRAWMDRTAEIIDQCHKKANSDGKYEIIYFLAIAASLPLGFIFSLFVNFKNTSEALLVVIFIISILGQIVIKSVCDDRFKMFFKRSLEFPLAQEPYLADFWAKIHRPLPSDGSSFPHRGWRWHIIERDSFVCQACGKDEFSRQELIARRIVPIASGGIDDPTNFITLCPPCGDQETWYMPKLYTDHKIRYGNKISVGTYDIAQYRIISSRR